MIKPLNNNVLVKSISETMANGIYLPSSNSFTYEVIGVGQKVLDINVGDKVIVNTEFLKEIKFNNQVSYLIKYDYILAIVED